MSPLVLEGETVTVSSRRFYLPGDILLFRHSGGGLRIHRLIGYRIARPLELITRGDECDSFDSPIRLQDVIGKVTAIAPRRPGCRWAGIRAWIRGALLLVPVASRVVLSRFRLPCSARSI
jgi:hypothetical protein